MSIKNEDVVKEFGRPRAINLVQEREYHWKSNNVGMKMQDLWGELHDKYNIIHIPLLDQQHFHQDVKEVAEKANTKDEFNRLMAERSWSHHEQLAEEFNALFNRIAANPSKLISPSLWALCLLFSRDRSLSNLHTVFSTLLQGPETSSSLPSPTPTPPRATSGLEHLFRKKTTRRARSERPTTGKDDRYNLRPRPAGTSQRKYHIRNTRKQHT
ncbi:hypothetical protein F4678DRAFT_437297 [Xylaria arbuscula]|nr:hypothetical protein F4678DRAFT_437297 [Xylaria arbuscula]